MKRNICVAVCILLIGLIANTARAAGSLIIVSDIDDTVKTTNVLHRDNMPCCQIADGQLIFAGMPELYQSLLGDKSSDDRLMFLSGSPFFLKTMLSKLLKDAHFPEHGMTLRSFSELLTKAYDYKTRHMNELYGGSKEQFILIGDDTEQDAQVYAAFSEKINQDKDKKRTAIYIRSIDGKPCGELPQDSICFVTAYDIALHELNARHLNAKQAAYVGNAVLNEKNDEAFFPGFQQCPQNNEQVNKQVRGLPDDLVRLKKKIEDRITSLCSQRAKACQTR